MAQNNISLGLAMPWTGGVTAVYLPTVGSSPYLAYGAKKLVSSYSGPLYRLVRTSDSATMDVSAASGSQVPDYSAVSTWIGVSTARVDIFYDQTGNTRHALQTTAAQRPFFDPSQALAGCCPILFDGEIGGANIKLRNMTVASISLDRRNVTVFDVLDPVVSYTSSINWEFGTGSLNLGTQSGTGLMVSGTTTAVPPRANPSVHAVQSSTSNIKVTVREQVVTVAALTAQTDTSINIGGSSLGAGYNGRGKRWGFVVYPATLSDADTLTVRQTLTSMFAIPTTFDARVVFMTDSIITGVFAELLKNVPEQMNLSTAEFFNMAVSGQKLSDANTDYATRCAPLYTTAYGTNKSFLIQNGGVNDLRASDSGATTYGRLTTFVSSARTTGFKVCVSTVLPVDVAAGWDGTKEAQRVAYNASVVSNAAGAHSIVDAANLTNLTNPANTTYYADGLHPTAAGSLILANSYRQALVDLGATATPAVITRDSVRATAPTVFYDPSYVAGLFQDRLGASSVTPANVGDPVGSMLDLSGNGKHAVAPSDAARPILRQDGNGKYYLEFDGVDDCMDISGSLGLFQNVSGGTMAACVAVRSQRVAIGGILFHTNGSGSTRTALQFVVSPAFKANISGRRLDADSSQGITSTITPTTNTPQVLWGEFDWANAQARLYANNVLDISNTFQTAGSTSNTAGTISRMGSGNGSAFCDMNLYGAVERAVVWSSDDRTTSAKYMGQLSGLTIT